MNKLQTILNDEIGRRTEISRSGTKIKWDERSDLPSQFMGTKMTETRSDAYGYNARSELTNAVKNATLNEYAYRYDDIGNRETSFERGMSATYAANCLNQYTDIEYSAVQPSTSNLQPLYDADGNQTLVKTKTGIWSVTYNGENRPVLWTCGTTNLVMKFDRMGRRVEYIESVASSNSSFIIQHSKFVYDGYLCIQRLNGVNNSITELFEWDPTEKVATRPMFMQYRVPGQTYALFYTHDGNKNVSEVVHFSRANGVAAHYEYAPFGEVTAQVRQGGIAAYDFSTLNPWRFSSEYADAASATVYYNYRHYEPMMGRWMSRDPIVGHNNYRYISNNALSLLADLLGLLGTPVNGGSSMHGQNAHGSYDDGMFDSVVSGCVPDFSTAKSGKDILDNMQKITSDNCCIETYTIAGHGWSYNSPRLRGDGIPGAYDCSEDPSIGLYSDGMNIDVDYAHGGRRISDISSAVKANKIRFCKECTIQIYACRIGSKFALELSEVTGCSVVAASAGCSIKGKRWFSGPGSWEEKHDGRYFGFYRIKHNAGEDPQIDFIGSYYDPQ